MNEAVYWLALQQKYWLLPAEKIVQAIREFGSMEGFWKANKEDLLKLGLDNIKIKKLTEYKSRIDLSLFEKQLDELRLKDIEVICYTGKEYPLILKNIGLHAPRLLFHKGVLLNFSDCVAVGGGRNCSENGLTAAYSISRTIAENGHTIVSGLATGVDTEAHKAAIDAKGKTVAVLPWIDPIYPPENSGLSKKIEAQGAILSECYKKPIANVKWRFIERNKIICGLSRFVVVIEPRDKGGSYNLAMRAFSQHKKVFILEPEESNEQVLKGYKSLLRKGAISIKSYKDLLAAPEKTEPGSKSSFYQSSLTSSEKVNNSW